MCCYGCQAVAQSIVNSGMTDFYRYRTDKPSKPEEIVPEFLSQLQAYDNPLVQKQFINEDGDIREVSLILEGIVCAACVWLNEQTLQALHGVIDININYATHRARIKWNNSELQLSEILEAISRIGYMAHPYDPERHQYIIEKERKSHLKRLGISGILGMQIMILAVAMYTGEWWGIDPGFLQMFRWISLALCTPLLFFSSSLFFNNAWRDLKNKQIGMDVPVALGMAIAFSASVYHTIINQGAVYYDSVSMFTFFLLIARYFEMAARKRSAEHTESLLNLTPAVATKIDKNNNHSIVPVAELRVGDNILVKPGENIAADGIVERGTSGVNESLVTGESYPATKSPGDKVIAGSTNTESPLIIEVKQTGDDTVLASIHRLLDETQRNKPPLAKLADRIAARFVLAILVVAGLVAIYWYLNGSTRWLEYTVATLVVTCPCALSLATPTALTAASGQLAKLGLLPVRNHVLETLAKASTFVFDKTGTLTHGRLSLTKTQALSSLPEKQCVQIAAAIEAQSEHPVARSLVEYVSANIKGDNSFKPLSVTNTPGEGITAKINDELWYIGNRKFISKHCGQAISERLNTEIQQQEKTAVILANKDTLTAVFYFDDLLRSDASNLISQLHHTNVDTYLYSGDQTGISQRIADNAGIEHVRAELKPADKLHYVQQLKAKGKTVVMVGDGINDAPVLAAADVSIAMGSGSELAVATADMILISNHISHLYNGLILARKTLSIIKQNLSWAIGYNIIAIPAAAMGYVQPWLAAIGMSVSSLVVVLNALRLSR